MLLCQGVRGAHASWSEARQRDTRGAHRDLGSAAGALCASPQVTHGRKAARYSRRRRIQGVSNAGARARRSAGALTGTQSACAALAVCAAPLCPTMPQQPAGLQVRDTAVSIAHPVPWRML